MPLFRCSKVTVQYPGSDAPLFDRLDLAIDTGWRTGIVGRNGRGKSSLLQLLHGCLPPESGSVDRPCPTRFFPLPVADEERPVRSMIREAIAPFDAWEREMEQLLSAGDDASLVRYHALFEQYTERGGFAVDALIEREAAALGLPEELLGRPYSTLSGGERTRACIIPLFAERRVFPLLDEPTNHLDLAGRRILGDYLAGKSGFIVVSHDRELLDRCCDHIAAINRADIRVLQGNYTRWREQMALEEQTELARERTVQREIVQLKQEAKQRRTWSMATERSKIGAFDKGFIGHKAAKMMKRALHAERRIAERIEEKEALLQNSETVRPIIFATRHDAPEVLVSLEGISASVGGRELFRSFDLTLRAGERVALVGRNGSGKSTLLDIVRGTHPITAGRRHVPSLVRIVSAYQTPRWEEGMLRDHVRAEGIDEMAFRTALGTFTVQGGIFERPLETFSIGERKKADLCRSCIFPHHLLVWDEPVNYIDIESKEQITAALLQHRPAMLFAEHDAAFIRAVATRVIDLDVDRHPQ